MKIAPHPDRQHRAIAKRQTAKAALKKAQIQQEEWAKKCSAQLRQQTMDRLTRAIRSMPYQTHALGMMNACPQPLEPSPPPLTEPQKANGWQPLWSWMFGK